MKNENKLRMSYELQKANFEAGKQKALENIDKELEKLELKKADLNLQIAKLQKARSKRLESSFRTYEEFKLQAEQQSQQAKTNQGF